MSYNRNFTDETNKSKCVRVCVYIYIYIYIYMCVCVCVCVCLFVVSYIYPINQNLIDLKWHYIKTNIYHSTESHHDNNQVNCIFLVVYKTTTKVNIHNSK